MKKIIVTVLLSLVSIISFANEPTYFVKNIDTKNISTKVLESQENTTFWIDLYKIINEAQNHESDKVVIKYDGKWKYVIPSPEAMIQLDIIVSHLTSGSSVHDGSFNKSMKEAFELAKKDKLIITIR